MEFSELVRQLASDRPVDQATVDAACKAARKTAKDLQQAVRRQVRLDNAKYELWGRLFGGASGGMAPDPGLSVSALTSSTSSSPVAMLRPNGQRESVLVGLRRLER